MTHFTFRNRMVVSLVDHMGDDASIVRAAKVSTQGAESLEAEATPGFMNFLMKNRHGSPFEHATMTFLVEAPLFVWREIMRHRMASYNEESGRYKTLEAVFYCPGDDRDLVQEGKPGHYIYVPGTVEQLNQVQEAIVRQSTSSYMEYLALLEAGIAREVARMVLPLNIMSSAYITMNPRALMNFLSLRTKDESSTYPSYPQREIEMVAEQMEMHFATHFPITQRVFHENGRVAP